MKNEEVIKEFANYGLNEKIKTKHLFFNKDVLFSYGYHYPLIIRLKDCFLINLAGYSMTTATHTGHLIRELTTCSNVKEFKKAKEKGEYKDIKIKTTEELKKLIGNYEGKLRFLTLADIEKLKIVKALE